MSQRAACRFEGYYSRMNQLKRYKALCAAIGCLFLTACAVQQTRVQQGGIPVASAPTADEDVYGKRVLSSLDDDYPIDTGSARHEQLSGIFNHLAESAALDPSDWRVFLFDAPDIADVRAVQGNYIFVWSGIFDVTENEDELAGLLASEIAHELARHTDPVEFSAASELLFGITDVATTVGIMFLTQGAVGISGSGMTRWAYVEAADLDPVDRVYSEAQVEDMAAIALLILEASDFSPDGLMQFWKRAGSNQQLQDRLKRLSRRIPPQERVAILETVMPRLPISRYPDKASDGLVKQTVYAGGEDPI